MTKKSFFSLPISLTKDFILIYRASLLAVFFAGAFFVKFSIDQKREKIEEEVFAAAEQVEKSITYNVDYLTYQIYYAAIQIKGKDSVVETKKIKKILSSFVNSVNSQVDISITWNTFSWIDKNGQLLVDGVSGIVTKPVDLSGRDYLKITSKVPDTIVFGNPVIGMVSQRFILPVGMGVFSKKNHYLGTLVFGLDINRILEKIDKAVPREDFSFIIIKDSKVAFVSNNLQDKDSSFIEAQIAKYELKQESLDVEQIVSSQNLFSKSSGFVSVRKIKNSPLKVLVFYDKEKSYQQIFDVALRQLFLMLLLLFSCAVLFQIIYKKIVKPISELSQFALKISQRDFSFTIDRPRGKELLDLYNTLNSVKAAFGREEVLLKRLEITNSNLSKANEAKAEFLSKSSHDIKNYIFGIYGLAKLILDKKNKAQIRENDDLQMIEIISDQSAELMHFVEDLLDTSQIDSGEFSLEKIRECSVKDLIERIVLLNKSLALRNKVSIQTNIENNLPQLKCDPRRMKQILTNLIANAIKYSNAKTNVTVSAQYLAQKNQIYIEIADEGIGMTKEEVEMLFSGHGKDIDKSDVNREIDSHGIGMSIVLKLVKLHHGEIKIDSQKGLGTRVKLHFNVGENFWNHAVNDDINQQVAKVDSKSLSEASSEIKSQKNKTILLVEDSPVNIKIISRILQNEGYKTRHVGNGKEAIRVLDEEEFDLILMDGEMPVMNGYEATKKIRQGECFEKFKNYKTIPIVALMSASDEKVIQKTKESGMNFHLEKSTSKTKLINAIESLLAQRKTN